MWILDHESGLVASLCTARCMHDRSVTIPSELFPLIRGQQIPAREMRLSCKQAARPVQWRAMRRRPSRRRRRRRLPAACWLAAGWLLPWLAAALAGCCPGWLLAGPVASSTSSHYAGARAHCLLVGRGQKREIKGASCFPLPKQACSSNRHATLLQAVAGGSDGSVARSAGCSSAAVTASDASSSWWAQSGQAAG